MANRKFKVACVQATPAIFDIERSLEKVIRLTGEVARSGCKLIVFPESFIPGYPAGLGFGTVVGSRTPGGREMFREYWQNSVEVPSEHVDKLGECAREHSVFLAVGVTERDRVSKTLYCSLLYFGPDGNLWVDCSRGGVDQPEGVFYTWDVFDPDGHFVEQVSAACPGDGENDMMLWTEDSAIQVTGFWDAILNRGGGDDDEDPQPMQVVCYRMK